MFSSKEKQMIAEAIEKVLLEINHPEMPTERPNFKLFVEGKESWSWAEILPNWKYESIAPQTTYWNENARCILSK